MAKPARGAKTSRKTKSEIETAPRKSGETHQISSGDDVLTTNQGTPISDNQNSLKAGARGPTLLEDFVLREKITHFDHERIPERIVHARGSGAHGVFQPVKSMRHLTKAKFLADPKKQTEVFVRFSTVAGGAGSVDLPRDVRGFGACLVCQALALTKRDYRSMLRR
jgi:catalase